MNPLSSLISLTSNIKKPIHFSTFFVLSNWTADILVVIKLSIVSRKNTMYIVRKQKYKVINNCIVRGPQELDHNQEMQGHINVPTLTGTSRHLGNRWAINRNCTSTSLIIFQQHDYDFTQRKAYHVVHWMLQEERRVYKPALQGR